MKSHVEEARSHQLERRARGNRDPSLSLRSNPSTTATKRSRASTSDTQRVLLRLLRGYTCIVRMASKITAKQASEDQDSELLPPRSSSNGSLPYPKPLLQRFHIRFIKHIHRSLLLPTLGPIFYRIHRRRPPPDGLSIPQSQDIKRSNVLPPCAARGRDVKPIRREKGPFPD